MKRKVIFLFFFLLYFSVNLFSSLISIEAEGISILTDNIDMSRKSAIKNAIENGLKKIVGNSYDKIENNVLGYEIIKESVEGNFLKEKIKIILDDSVLNFRKNIITVLIGSFLSDNYSEKLNDYVETIFKKISPNFLFLRLNEIKKEEEFLEEASKKDIDYIIILKVNVEKIKEIATLNKIFAKINCEIFVYSKKLELLASQSFSKDIVYSTEEKYFKLISNFVKNFLLKNLQIFKKQVQIKNRIKVTLFSPPDFKKILSFIEILDKYNLKYNYDEIYGHTISFIIFNITSNQLYDILKRENYIQKMQIENLE